MRLFLILALLVASAGFAPAAGAHAHSDLARHHMHHQGHDGDSDTGKAHAVAHVCPGCALVGQPFVAAAGPAPIALPRLPANPPSPRSFDANPIPPPPRSA